VDSQKITLTVQSNGSGLYRLGVNTLDSATLFKCRGRVVKLILSEKLSVHCKTTCGVLCDSKGLWFRENPKTKQLYRKKGYDLYSKELSSWIVENEFHLYKPRNPTKLYFDVMRSEESFILEYQSNAHNIR